MINTNDVKTEYLGLVEMKDEDIEVGWDYHDINSFNQLNTQIRIIFAFFMLILEV